MAALISIRKFPALRAATMVGPGLIPATVMLAFSSATPHQILETALDGVVYSLCISSLCWSVLTRVGGPLMSKPPLPRWLYLLGIFMVLATVGCLGASLILLGVGLITRREFWFEFVRSLKLSFVLTLIFGVITFFQQVIVGRLNRATRDAERLRQTATEARLSSLESRIHPHFLFNTLNSISALIREDPAQAERTVERLASLLRFSLDANESRLVPLSLELRIVRDYLDIEKTRFGPRLRYQIDVPASLDHVEIPPMSVQTLVENSVKHAVSTLREGASIEIRARLDASGAPVIDVIDDGPGFDATALRAGHGLDLLQSRLAALFGPRAALEFAAEPGRMRTSVILGAAV